MLRTVLPAASYPVTLAEAKTQLRVAASDTTNDTLINALIAAATTFCETLVQRAFVARTVEWVLPGWREVLRLPIAPVVAADVVSIKYVDWQSQTQLTLDPTAYVIQTRGESVVIFPKFGTIWPLAFSASAEPIVVRFNAGYHTISTDLPPNVKAAILLQIRHLWSLGEVNPALRKDTVFGLGEKQYQLTPEIKALVPDAVNALMLSEVW